MSCTQSTSSVVLYDDPWPVLQTDTTASSGNALQACVASLFHLELSAVPNFIQAPNGYESAMRDFLKPEYTVRKVILGSSQSATATSDVGKVCILRGQSPRGNFGHVVVACRRSEHDFDVLWDPHPEGTGLHPNVPYGWYMVFEPSG